MNVTLKDERIETAGALSYAELKTLIVREQFIYHVLSRHLNERQFVSVTEMCLQAHKQTVTTSKQENFPILGYKEDDMTTAQRQRKALIVIVFTSSHRVQEFGQ